MALARNEQTRIDVMTLFQPSGNGRSEAPNEDLRFGLRYATFLVPHPLPLPTLLPVCVILQLKSAIYNSDAVVKNRRDLYLISM